MYVLDEVCALLRRLTAAAAVAGWCGHEGCGQRYQDAVKASTMQAGKASSFFFTI